MGKQIEAKEFREFGYLQEINRQFLHPLGMALEVIVEIKSGKVLFNGIWDYRDIPEGILFLNDKMDKEKMVRVQTEQEKRRQTRVDKLGYAIQPIINATDEAAK